MRFFDATEHFDALREGLLNDMAALLAENPQLFEKHYDADLDLPCSALTIPFAEELELLAPFGNQNPKPLLRVRNVRISRIRPLGTEGGMWDSPSLTTAAAKSPACCSTRQNAIWNCCVAVMPMKSSAA